MTQVSRGRDEQSPDPRIRVFAKARAIAELMIMRASVLLKLIADLAQIADQAPSSSPPETVERLCREIDLAAQEIAMLEEQQLAQLEQEVKQSQIIRVTESVNGPVRDMLYVLISAFSSHSPSWLPAAVCAHHAAIEHLGYLHQEWNDTRGATRRFPRGSIPHVMAARIFVVEYREKYQMDPAVMISMVRDEFSAVSKAFAASPVSSPPKSEPSHNPDFTVVTWYGTRYTFALGNQSRAVAILWDVWQSGGHAIHEKTVGEQIQSTSGNFRLAHTFRGHPAWGTMIRPAEKKGLFRLFPPESPENPR